MYKRPQKLEKFVSLYTRIYAGFWLVLIVALPSIKHQYSYDTSKYVLFCFSGMTMAVIIMLNIAHIQQVASYIDDCMPGAIEPIHPRIKFYVPDMLFNQTFKQIAKRSNELNRDLQSINRNKKNVALLTGCTVISYFFLAIIMMIF